MTRAELHRLVDALPDSALDPVGGLLERTLADPMVAILDQGPWDDEPTSAEEDADAAEGLAAYERGEGVALVDLMPRSAAGG
ncbi:MAG: hypothetical protein ACR2MY_06665 [Candidatus Dormibacteria bacterium]